MADTHLPPFWKERTLAVIGAPVRKEGKRFLEAQAQAEGSKSRKPKAQWNPLNSTMKIQGSTNFNEVPVQNYPRATWGVCATAMTLTNGNYPGILGALQNGSHTAEWITSTHADEIRKWGTNPDLMLKLLKEIP